ncbi:DgyrCDS4909 [Dimorphilus gyrociliatus]|uniref:DgyrCDS4909 n=1 Tax=Dimorphilus gyrociliatus TaxID=2664684 RepID=A0A7I8VJU8_9ANNE|nr:DgyrCDS4909 [Dimorphilus gyrociliatus]
MRCANSYTEHLFREIRKSAERVMINSLKRVQNNANENHYDRGFWDALQIDCNCCGINTYQDWNGKIPESCSIYATKPKNQSCFSQKPSKHSNSSVTSPFSNTAIYQTVFYT